jgi:hypothetical protein
MFELKSGSIGYGSVWSGLCLDRADLVLARQESSSHPPSLLGRYTSYCLKVRLAPRKHEKNKIKK